jgi:hypothetical protein
VFLQSLEDSPEESRGRRSGQSEEDPVEEEEEPPEEDLEVMKDSDDHSNVDEDRYEKNRRLNKQEMRQTSSWEGWMDGPEAGGDRRGRDGGERRHQGSGESLDEIYSPSFGFEGLKDFFSGRLQGLVQGGRGGEGRREGQEA